MLQLISNYNEFKKKFSVKFNETLNANLQFKSFLYELLIAGTAYVIGGYIRDIAQDKESRDLDILVNLPNQFILDTLQNSSLKYSINRLNGIKIKLDNFEVDLWSIEHNWAFENKLVEKNDDNLLESISNGCFYNYDSLVINVHTNNLNVRLYNEMIEKNTLNIIQKNSLYKKLNPTVEANILRAFYLKEKYGLNFSDNCYAYLSSRISYLQDQYGASSKRLNDYIIRYPKYQEILDSKKIDLLIKSFEGNNIQQKLFS